MPALPHGDLLLREVDVLGAARADAGHLEGRSCGSPGRGKLEQKTHSNVRSDAFAQKWETDKRA